MTARPVYIVHVSGQRPHAIDKWTRPYKSEATAAAQAVRLVGNYGAIDWVADIYRISHEDFRGPDPGLVLTKIRRIERTL